MLSGSLVTTVWYILVIHWQIPTVYFRDEFFQHVLNAHEVNHVGRIEMYTADPLTYKYETSTLQLMKNRRLMFKDKSLIFQGKSPIMSTNIFRRCKTCSESGVWALLDSSMKQVS
jgi:hypothetical protein